MAHPTEAPNRTVTCWRCGWEGEAAREPEGLGLLVEKDEVLYRHTTKECPEWDGRFPRAPGD